MTLVTRMRKSGGEKKRRRERESRREERKGNPLEEVVVRLCSRDYRGHRFNLWVRKQRSRRWCRNGRWWKKEGERAGAMQVQPREHDLGHCRSEAWEAKWDRIARWPGYDLTLKLPDPTWMQPESTQGSWQTPGADFCS